MKNIFTFLTLFTFSSIFAIDRFVDPNLSSGNGTTLFTNITSAVAAAVNGDRIIVASNTYNEATLTISKSLKIIPQTAGATIVLNADIVVAGFPGMKLEILGFNLLSKSFFSNIIQNGTNSNRAKVSIIDCSCRIINFNNAFYDLNCINNIISVSLKFKYGNVIKSTMNGLYLLDEPSSNNENGRVLIAANNIFTICSIHNNNVKFILANNNLKDLFVTKWIQDNLIFNKIINNNFSGIPKLHFSMLQGEGPNQSGLTQYQTQPITNYNFVMQNNLFENQPLFSNYTNDFYRAYFNYDTDNIQNSGVNMVLYYYDIEYANTPNVLLTNINFQSNASMFPNNNSSGTFNWSYNGLIIPNTNPTNVVFTNSQGNTNVVDGGNPNHDYYDIDLTINDRGVNGGPYSQLNYNAANPNNSKTFIFDLEMPTDLFPGENVNITAKGYHKN